MNANKKILAAVSREIRLILDYAQELQTKPKHEVYIQVDHQYSLRRNGIMKYMLNEPVFIAMLERGLITECHTFKTGHSNRYKITS